MSSDKGYVLIYRSVWDCWVWKEKPFDRGRAWIDLILMVNHDEATIMFNNRPLKIERGQCVTSLSILASRWGWSRSKVKRFLDDLKSEHMIDEKRNTHGTLLTIENYSVYQGRRNTKRNTDGTQTKQQTKHRRTQTNNDRNNVTNNEEIKEAPPPLSQEEQDALDEAEGWGYD